MLFFTLTHPEFTERAKDNVKPCIPLDESKSGKGGYIFSCNLRVLFLFVSTEKHGTGKGP